MLQPKNTDWLNGYKSKTRIYAVYKKPTSDFKTHIVWKWENGKIYFMQMGSTKKSEVAILISDKIDLKIKNITRYKEGYYLMIKRSIQDADIAIVNTYAPNIGAAQYIRQTLTDIKWEIDKNTIIVKDFNTPLTPMDRSSKEKLIRKHES